MKLRFCLTVILFFQIVSMNAQINRQAEIKTSLIRENGDFPNNNRLPVVIYKNVFPACNPDDIEKVLFQNGWGNSWRNGIYNFHHYHSTAHEALAVYRGWARVQLGGDKGEIFKIEKGDLVILPAGIAHKRIDSGSGFAVLGAYPEKQHWDMNYGKPEELNSAKRNIAAVKLPRNDPVFGGKSKLFVFWAD